MIKVIVADDHPLTREGVKQTLGEMLDVCVIGEVETGPELEDALLSRVPDILVLDIRMPGFNAVKEVPKLRTRYPKMKIVIMTAYPSQHFVQSLMTKVEGYLLKKEAPDVFAMAVREVSKDRRYYSDEALDLAYNGPQIPKLSEQELRSLELAEQGLTALAIARELYVSERSVETYLQDAYHKLGARNRAAAVAKAIRLGLLPDEMEEAMT
jgi:DNA-binding NarL/FixJ family response regulator